MIKVFSILSLTVVVGCLAVATVADAQNQTPALAPPPLMCVNAAKTVRVHALDQSLNPATAGSFPVPVACPTNTLGVTECLRWSYKYELLSGNTISLSAVTSDSNVDIVAATGSNPGPTNVLPIGTSDSAIGGFGSGVFDFYTVRFASQGNVVLGHIYTRTNVDISTVTAIAKVGNTGATTCQIAGVGNINSDSQGTATTLTTKQIDTFEECQIELALDSKGCTKAITILNPPSQGGTCNATVNEELAINGKMILGGQCNKPSGLVVEGSSCVWYCPTSFGTCFRVCK